MPTWPSSLPQVPLAVGYQEQPQNTVLRSSMDAGASKQRLRFTAAARYCAVAYGLDSTQLDAFLAFFDDDLVRGALEFFIPHPRTGAMVTARIVAQEPPYNLIQAGLEWNVSFKLEILP